MYRNWEDIIGMLHIVIILQRSECIDSWDPQRGRVAVGKQAGDDGCRPTQPQVDVANNSQGSGYAGRVPEY